MPLSLACLGGCADYTLLGGLLSHEGFDADGKAPRLWHCYASHDQTMTWGVAAEEQLRWQRRRWRQQRRAGQVAMASSDQLVRHLLRHPRLPSLLQMLHLLDLLG